MIHFNYNSEELITIRIVDDFSNHDRERIALLIESSQDNNFETEITFQVETDLQKNQMKILNDFCQQLPYKFQIDLKYPPLLW